MQGGYPLLTPEGRIGVICTMARYEHLPIYKQAMDVAIHFEKIVAGFSRYHKYTLGTELRDASRGIVSLIIQANSARDKAPALRVLRVRLDGLLVLVRLAKEVKVFKSFKAYQFVVEQMASGLPADQQV